MKAIASLVFLSALPLIAGQDLGPSKITLTALSEAIAFDASQAPVLRPPVFPIWSNNGAAVQFTVLVHPNSGPLTNFLSSASLTNFFPAELRSADARFYPVGLFQASAPVPIFGDTAQACNLPKFVQFRAADWEVNHYVRFAFTLTSGAIASSNSVFYGTGVLHDYNQVYNDAQAIIAIQMFHTPTPGQFTIQSGTLKTTAPP